MNPYNHVVSSWNKLGFDPENPTLAGDLTTRVVAELDTWRKKCDLDNSKQRYTLANEYWVFISVAANDFTRADTLDKKNYVWPDKTIKNFHVLTDLSNEFHEAMHETLPIPDVFTITDLTVMAGISLGMVYRDTMIHHIHEGFTTINAAQLYDGLLGASLVLLGYTFGKDVYQVITKIGPAKIELEQKISRATDTFIAGVYEYINLHK